MKRTSILIIIFLCLPSFVLYAQYSSEAGKVKQLSDEYDQRGYANGKPVTVDGNLNISTATGVPSYVYPISNFTSNGHQMSVSLNYAGSVSFTTFHRYYESLENFNGSWSKYHRSSPAWLLGVNGFAVQAFAFASTFVNDPVYMKFWNNQNPLVGTKYTDKHFVWTIDGYDICNRMGELEPVSQGNKRDIVRLLRSDGSILELHNVRSYDDVSGAEQSSFNPDMYRGDYYPHEANPSGLGKMEFDSTYIDPDSTIDDPSLMPRILRYYPGDGLEYVFREFFYPFGVEPGRSQWSDGRNGVPIFGGGKSFPTIFYLVEINNGTETVISFDYERHNPGEQMFLHPDSAKHLPFVTTRGRALLKGFTGHTIVYGNNAVTIQAMGRSTDFFFATMDYGYGYTGSPDETGQKGEMFWRAKRGGGNIALADTSLTVPSDSYRSMQGFIRKIVDSEQRETWFDYERFTREYKGINFPHTGLNFSDQKPVLLAAWRLTRVIDATTDQRLRYHSARDTVLNVSGGILDDPHTEAKRRVKFVLTPTVKDVRKYDRDGKHLVTQAYDMYYYSPVGLTSDFTGYSVKDRWKTSFKVTDEVTEKWTNSVQEYRAFEFQTHEAQWPLPYTQLYSTEVQADSHFVMTINNYFRADSMSILPLKTTTRQKYGINGTWFYKQRESYSYLRNLVRTYTVPEATSRIGKEVQEKTTLVYNPDNEYDLLYMTTTRYLHLPLLDTVMTARVRTWNKFKQRADFFELEAIARKYGDELEWETALLNIPAYDTVEANRLHHLPPVYNLEERTLVADANNNILQGMGKRYARGFSQDDTSSIYRGALLADSIIGKGGTAILANTYTYYGGRLGYHKSHMRTVKAASGALSQMFYDYSNVQTAGGTILHNDNSIKSQLLYGRRGIEEFESPLGEHKYVRTFRLGGTPITRTLRTMFERTYHDQISASVDANGWYSRFDYDKNGRLRTAWTPYDFPGDSLYEERWSGTYRIPMPGYTVHSWRMDTLACGTPSRIYGLYGQGLLRQKDYTRLVAGWPISTAPCGSGETGEMPAPRGQATDKPKHEKVMLTAGTPIPYPNVQRHTGFFSGATSREMQDAISLDSAALRLHITKVFGRCVNTRVSVLKPKLIWMAQEYPEYDTLLTKVYVLNCGKALNAMKRTKGGGMAKFGGRGDGEVLAPPPHAYQLLELDLTPIRSSLLTEAWVVAVSVETPGAEVELVNEGRDWQPELVIKGAFRRVGEYTDYTVRYETKDRPDEPLTSTAWAKIDDSLHTASSGVGGAIIPEDNSRYRKTENAFGADYRVLASRETKTLGGTTWTDSVTTRFTGLGKGLKTTDELGDTTSTVYDELGRPIKTYRDDGALVEYEYTFNIPYMLLGDFEQEFNGFCEMRTATQYANGIVRSWQFYDVYGRLRREIAPDTAVTKYEYDLLGRLIAVVNPKGDTTRYWYDDFGRVKYKFQPDLGYISYAYDNVGNVRFTQTQEQADSIRLTFTEYDDLKRVTLIGEARLGGEPGGGGGHGIGGANGKKEGVMFPPHPALNLNRLTDQINGDVLQDGGTSGILTANKTVWLPPQTTLPAFWTENQLEETTCQPTPTLPGQPQGALLRHPVGYHNDPGLPLSTPTTFENISQYPENARIAIHYDELPQTGGSVWFHFPTEAQWNALAPKGAVRNLKGRESAVAYRQHAGEPYHFVVMSYDERGRMEALLRYTENLGFDAVYYTYNSMNQVTSVRVADRQRQYTTWYGYNTSGRVDSVWTKLGVVGTGLGVANPVYPSTQSRPVQPDMSYAYTKRWQVDTLHYPIINTLVAYAYNGNRWLDSLRAMQGGTMIFRQKLFYNQLGQIVQQNSQHAGMPQRLDGYGYNPRGQMTVWESYPAPTRGMIYQYDKAGNRTFVDNSFQSLSEYYQYSDTLHPNRLMKRYHQLDTTTYTYDANGSLKTKIWQSSSAMTIEDFWYDPVQGVLTKYQRWSGAPQGFGQNQVWRYRYSPGGEREQKRLYETPYSKRWTYYLLGGNQLAVYDGIETSESSCGSSQNSVYLWPTEYITYGLGAVHNMTTRPIDATTSEKEYKLQDHLGSTRVVLHQGGAVLGTYDYEPYGGRLISTGPEPRKGFIDKEKDDESNLGDFGVRKYDDGIGRFTSVDPLWEKFRAWSPYQYAINSPLIMYDSDGKVVKQTFPENATDQEIRADKVEYRRAVDYLKSKGIYGALKKLEDKEEVINLQVVRGSPTDEGNETRYDPVTKTIYYNPQAGLMTSNGPQTPAFGIIHEVGHATIHVEAIENNKLGEYANQIGDDIINTFKDPSYVKPEEMEVLRRFEIPAARKAGMNVRTEYEGFTYETMGPTTTRPTTAGKETIRQMTVGGEK